MSRHRSPRAPRSACARGPQPEPFQEVIASGSFDRPSPDDVRIPWSLRWTPLGSTDYFALSAGHSDPSFVGVGMEFRAAALENGLAVWYLIQPTDHEVTVIAAVGFVRHDDDVDTVLAYFDALDEPLRLEMAEAPNGTGVPVQLVYGATLVPRLEDDPPYLGQYLCAASFDAAGDVIVVDAYAGDSERCPEAIGPTP
jgi:hypothetical protein